MRIQELEICNFRGIKELKLEPKGNNFLISGPNGSGKSAIVDAVDFLLTGQVSRMTGPGTKDIKLKEHAPHVMAEAKDCWVKATITLPYVSEPVEIKRVMDSPRNLVSDDEYRDVLEPIQELASRGQHVLTRREILNYVTADAGTRAKQIQNLLKISEVESTRKKLLKVQNSLQKDFQNAESNLNNSKAHIKTTVDLESFDEDLILNFVNENRDILGVEPLTEPNSANIKQGVKSPGMLADYNINLELLKKDLEKLQSTDFKEEMEPVQGEYKKLHLKIISDDTSPKDRLQLTKLGLKLTGDSCPLCDTSWDPDQLQSHLTEKLKHLKEVERDLERMKKLSSELSEAFKSELSLLVEVINASSVLGLSQEAELLNDYKEDLLRIDDALDRDDYGGESIPTFTAMEEVGTKILEAAVDRYGAPSPEQTAWDKLNRLEENLKYYKENLSEYQKAKLAFDNVQILHNSFIESRDHVLDSLYSEVKDRFVELYRKLHGADEADFDAVLTSEGAGVDLKVQFHGEGKHPPHALHSEGHQDSMGICLYLALAERLTQGYIDLVILDDVMMSVDAPHRRQICHLLADFFKGKQFFITTHDQTWARQLQLEGVIKSRNRVELSNWTIQDGPRINLIGDIWGPIEKDLSNNDVPSAAAKLRRGSEEYFGLVCSYLQAPVKYKFNGQNDLGDLLSGAQSSYKRHLKQAKTAARSWENYEELDKLKSIEDYSKDIFGRVNVERWAVNPAVHFNEWADFTPQDFKPVVESFHDLLSLFQCDTCGTILHLVMSEGNPEAVKCNCGSFNWNLKGK